MRDISSNGVVSAVIPSAATGVALSIAHSFQIEYILYVKLFISLCIHAFMVFNSAFLTYKCSISSLFVGKDDTSPQFVHETEGSNDDIHV